jgi:hypothetical protein
MTVKQYYKHFVSIFGALTAAVGSLPLTGELFPKDYASYLFPPLGPSEPLFRAAAIAFVVLTTLIVYFAKDKAFVISKRGRVNALAWLFLAVIIGFTSHMALNWRFVRSIPVPSTAEHIVVSVGYERTSYAKDHFGDVTDWDLLRLRGPTEEEIWKLWTSSSILLSRAGLCISYLLFLICATAIGSLAIVFDKIGVAPSP